MEAAALHHRQDLTREVWANWSVLAQEPRERKQKRIEMEAAKIEAMEKEEEEMVRKLYSFKQMEELREEIKRRKAPPPRFEPRA